MVLILLGEYGLIYIYAPVDAERVIENRDTAIGLWSVKVVTLILENGHVAQHRETVGEATGHEKLAMVLLREQTGHMLSERGRSLADIHRHVEHLTAHATHELGLCVGRTLEMKATHHTACGARLVILHKVDFSHQAVKLLLVITLEKIAACILEHSRLKDQHPLYVSFYYIHLFSRNSEDGPHRRSS